MTAHTWVSEAIDGGSVGVSDFWVCSVCGASGGPCWPLAPQFRWPPFMADGTGLKLSEDCAVALAEVRVAKYLRQFYGAAMGKKRRKRLGIVLGEAVT